MYRLHEIFVFCPLTPVSAVSVTSHLTGYTHVIQAPLNCKSENVIYLWRCTKCGHNFTVNKNHTINTNTHNIDKEGTIYCGMTKRRFALRLAEHRDYAKSNKVEEPSGLHFNLPGHSFHHLEGLAVEQVRSSDPFILKARESWIIQKLDCFRNGQNKEPWNTTSLASVGFLIFLSSSFTSWRSASFWYFGYLYMSTFSFILLLWTWSLRGRNMLAISITFETLKQQFCLSFEPIFA